MWTSSALFGAKKIGFFEIYMVSAHGQGGWTSADNGIDFSRFCADVFYGRSLKTLKKCFFNLRPDVIEYQW